MAEEIVIDIDPDGGITVEGKGFEGPDCKLLTKALEEDLGAVERVQEKPEMRRTATRARKAVR